MRKLFSITEKPKLMIPTITKFLKLSILILLTGLNNDLSAQTYNLHWGSTSWVAPSYAKALTNIDGSGVDATISITNTSPAGNISASGAASNDAFQYNTPKVGTANITWFLPGTTATNPLALYVDWDDLNSTVVTVITFSRPVNDVSFYLGDMDRTNPLSYVDRFTFTGTRNGVIVPNPIVTKFQAAFNAPDTVLISGNTAFGNAALTNANAGTNNLVSQGSTIYVQFGNPVTQITLLWDQGPGATGNPVGQAVVIGDIKFTRVNPEYPPTADNFTNKPMAQGNTATGIPALIASDLDGTVVSYIIKSLPDAAQGVLSIPCPATPVGATCTGGFADLTAAVLAANPAGIVLTKEQSAAMRFDPVFNFSGNASFSFDAFDNHGNVSNTALYVLPVASLPPVSNNIMENSMPNTNGATDIQALNSSDVDGIITGYQITSIPPVGEGELSIPCPPTLTGATCSGGYQNLTAAILSGYPSGMPLTAIQMAGMRFDPAAAFLGKSTFTYNAIDNSGLVSNTANYTIPVTASATTARPPLADNIIAQPLNNSLSSTAIPPLLAKDLDGTVASYTITTIPDPASGILYCCGGAPVTAAQILTPAQISTLAFDPAPEFTGTATFNYFAADNMGLLSNTATYDLPVVNTAPTAININRFVPFNSAAAAIPDLSGSDEDGTLTAFTITTVPTAAQGTISVPCPPTPTGGTCSGGFVSLTEAVLSANPGGIVLTPVQAAGIRFEPTTGFSGDAPFTYTCTDNNGNISAAANYKITVIKQPPVTVDVTNVVLSNTLGAIAVSSLIGTDQDGTVVSYSLFGLPDPSQGELSIPCPATPAGATCSGGFASLTAAVLDANPNGISLTPAQATELRFDPTSGFTGLAAFKYGAIDNDGLLSNISIYTIPVSGSGNIPPVARNILTASMPSTNGPTAVPALIGTDADGTITSYTLNSIPSASQGVLSVPCPPTPTGATCSGGFADLTAAVLAAGTAGIDLTPAQVAGMRFDPDPDFSGFVEFAYTTTDDNGASSAGAVYTIPVTSLPPIANPVAAPPMSHNNGPTAVPALIASDPDGLVSTYYFESIPPVSQGVLSIPCPPTLTGATCTGGFQNLTTAILANYSIEGMPLTATQMAGIRFDPDVNYIGNVVFNYHVRDNTDLISNTATYTIPVTGLPPLSNNIKAQKMYNSNGPTAIPALSSSDPDGTINNFIIISIPPVSQGVLSIPCPPTPSGASCSGGFADLTAAVLSANPGGISLSAVQAAGLQFDPDAGYVGDILFNYAAYDNNGNISNVAAYTIPTGTPLVLPLTLVSFTGQRNGNNILLNWKSENEVNASKFDVEYSTDGINYANGGFVNANNNAVNNYQYTLFNFTAPVYYIRLKMVDVDGNYKYSNVIRILFNTDYKKAITVLLNPAVGKLVFNLSSDEAANAYLQLINKLGQIVYKQTNSLAKGDNIITINEISNLAAGVYTLQAMVNNELLSANLLIK